MSRRTKAQVEQELSYAVAAIERLSHDNTVLAANAEEHQRQGDWMRGYIRDVRSALGVENDDELFAAINRLYGRAYWWQARRRAVQAWCWRTSYSVRSWIRTPSAVFWGYSILIAAAWFGLGWAAAR